MLTAFAILTVVFALIVGWDYLPRAKPMEVKQAESALAHSKLRELETAARLRSAEQELEHTHRMVVSTDAPLKRDSLAYVFAKRNLDTTNIDSLKKQVKRADSVIVDQQTKIVALEADTASKAHVIIIQRALLAVKDEKFAAIEKLNKSIAAQIPTLGQKVRHDGKVIGFTLAAVGLAKLVLSATGH